MLSLSNAVFPPPLPSQFLFLSFDMASLNNPLSYDPLSFSRLSETEFRDYVYQLSLKVTTLDHRCAQNVLNHRGFVDVIGSLIETSRCQGQMLHGIAIDLATMDKTLEEMSDLLTDASPENTRRAAMTAGHVMLEGLEHKVAEVCVLSVSVAYPNIIV